MGHNVGSLVCPIIEVEGLAYSKDERIDGCSMKDANSLITYLEPSLNSVIWTFFSSLALVLSLLLHYFMCTIASFA